MDNYRGYRCCTQCRQHRDVTTNTAVQEALQLRRNWTQMERTPLSENEHVQNIWRCTREAIRDARQDCHCGCAGGLGPEPEKEPPVVNQILEPPPKRHVSEYADHSCSVQLYPNGSLATVLLCRGA